MILAYFPHTSIEINSGNGPLRRRERLEHDNKRIGKTPEKTRTPVGFHLPGFISSGNVLLSHNL
jgi:hypothetical protein